MVQYCSVSGCSSRSRRDLVAFFRFPTVRKRFGLDLQEMIKLRREKWVECIPRFKNAPEDKFKHARVCANHFISGKPAALQDVDDPDWVPSLNLCLEPRRVRLRRLAAGIGLAPPCAGGLGFVRQESRPSLADLPPGPVRIRTKPGAGPDSGSDEGNRDVPNDRFLEPEVEIEELECRLGVEDSPHKYGCPLCKTTFSLQDELRAHLSAHGGGGGGGPHSPSSPHPCVVCRASLPTRAELQQHWVRRHSLNLLGEGGRFVCEGCGRAFDSKAEMREHFAGGDIGCGCRDGDSSGRRHLSPAQRPPTPTATYACAHCDMQFPHAGRLAQHAICHAGETPGRAYYHSQNLLKQPDGIRPHRCHLCPLAFTQQNHLERHLEDHAVTGD